MAREEPGAVYLYCTNSCITFHPPAHLVQWGQSKRLEKRKRGESVEGNTHTICHYLRSDVLLYNVCVCVC